MGNKQNVKKRRVGPSVTKVNVTRNAALVRWGLIPGPLQGSDADVPPRRATVRRTMIFDEAAPRLTASGTTLIIKDAKGAKLCGGASRHANHNKRVKQPVLRERHAKLLELPIIEPTAGCDQDEEVKVYQSRESKRRGEPPLARVFFLKTHGKLHRKALWLGSQTRKLRQAGDAGDWRLDEKTGNWYLPVGIGTGIGHTSSMAQEGKGQHIRSYTFPGDVTAQERC